MIKVPEERLMLRLGLVAGGAVLGFVVIHGHLKHVVASDANSMDFHGRFLAGPGRGRMRG
jgi:hypothetical protein